MRDQVHVARGARLSARARAFPSRGASLRALEERVTSSKSSTSPSSTAGSRTWCSSTSTGSISATTHPTTGLLPIQEVALIALQICAALAEAHALGIVDRDLKPANVFLARAADGTSRVKLLDFGISKILENDPDESKTLEGIIMGTPYFMAPEQARGEDVDPRTDIWALGVMLYVLLTGKLPFEGDAPTRTLAYILSRDPMPPSMHSPSMPPPLEDLILRRLEKDRARRPACSRSPKPVQRFRNQQGLRAVLDLSSDLDKFLGGACSRPPRTQTDSNAPCWFPSPDRRPYRRGARRRWAAGWSPQAVLTGVLGEEAAGSSSPRSLSRSASGSSSLRSCSARTFELPCSRRPTAPLPLRLHLPRKRQRKRYLPRSRRRNGRSHPPR